jgi:Protein of unknown function (DUF3486)
MSNRRTGKIARLPKDIRDVVNLMLQDGATAAVVIAKLEGMLANGAQGVDGKPIEIPNEQNVTNWVQGGFKDWQAEQQRLDDMRFKREMALEIVRQNEGGKIQEAALQIASSQLYEVISEFDIQSLKEMLAEQPEEFANLVNSLAKLSKSALDYEKYRDAVVSAKTELQKLRDPKQELTDADRKAIVEKVDEILGLK